MSGSADVIVVGGGIAGSSLATVMARDGYQVVVLERQAAYRDKVRGEWLACRGVVQLLPGVPGALDVGHPEACEALTQAADAAGATVIRGVGDIDLEPGESPVV